MESFAAAGPHSVAALATASGGSEVRHYSTATGRYGDVIASDPGSGSSYEVVGATANRVLLAHKAAADGDVRVETWNTTTDSSPASPVLPADKYSYVTGRIDGVHNRGAILLHGTDKADLVLPWTSARAHGRSDPGRPRRAGRNLQSAHPRLLDRCRLPGQGRGPSTASAE
ncbi:hypothetical protein E4K10_40295 [Streptomyces sp. T1317-0309]|nr:hypothetical protein E4K10_40295 [Streptomyces sp. T1317-0309]